MAGEELEERELASFPTGIMGSLPMVSVETEDSGVEAMLGTLESSSLESLKVRTTFDLKNETEENSKGKCRDISDEKWYTLVP